MSHGHQERTYKAYNAGDLRSSGVENVEHCLIIGVKKNMLPRPFVAPSVGGNGNRKELLVGNGLMPLRGVPDAIKPFALEVSPETNCHSCIRSHLYIRDR